jgi:integrase
LLGLRWQDVDLESAGRARRRTKSTAKSGPIFTAPKNGKGRSMKLTRHAVEALTSHRAVQNAERLKAGGLWQIPLGYVGVVRAEASPSPLSCK